jgi:hypothetical protein
MLMSHVSVRAALMPLGDLTGAVGAGLGASLHAATATLTVERKSADRSTGRIANPQ